MRTTEDLIETLAKDVRPMPRHGIERRMFLGMLVGGATALLLLTLLYGIRSDLNLALRDSSFWVRWIYTASLGVGAILVTRHLARPGSEPSRWIWFLAVPVLLLMGIGITELAHASPSEWLSLWLGRYWEVCPGRILLLSIPIFLGLLWAFRRFAPTRLSAAGAAAGLTAGAWSATLYCLHCPEVSAIFVLTWFSLGIALATAAGVLLGRHLLRW